MTWEQLQREALEWGCRLVPLAFVKGRPSNAMTSKEADILAELRRGPASIQYLLACANLPNAESLRVHISHIRTKLPEGVTIVWSRETLHYSLEKTP